MALHFEHQPPTIMTLKKPKKTSKKRTWAIPIMFGSTPMLRRCPNCDRTRSTTHVVGFCAECESCVACGAAPWIDRDTRLCANCVCQTCGGTNAPMGRDEDGDTACGTCRKVVICTICSRNFANCLRKGEQTPTQCYECAGRSKMRCYFCNGKASKIMGNDSRANRKYYLVCAICHNTFCCWRKDCIPTKQCGGCTDRQHEQEQADTNPTPRWNNPFGNWVNNPIKFWDATPITSRKINRSPRMLGIEIECAGATNVTLKTKAELYRVLKKWGASMVYDGSLRSGGFEITTSPAAGDVFLKQIDEITDALRAAGAFVDEQCGLHVHIDARDHHYADIRKLVRYYAFLEPALIRTQPFDRILRPNPNNGKYYCLPCGEKYLTGLGDTSAETVSKMYTDITREKLLSNIYGTDTWRPPRREHYTQAKYHAFNFHSWFYKNRRTVESRIHAGTIVPRKIKDWGMLWASIVDEAYRMTDKVIPVPGPVDDSIAQLKRVAPTPRIKTYIQTRLDTFRKKYDDYYATQPATSIPNNPFFEETFEAEIQDPPEDHDNYEEEDF